MAGDPWPVGRSSTATGRGRAFINQSAAPPAVRRILLVSVAGQGRPPPPPPPPPPPLPQPCPCPCPMRPCWGDDRPWSQGAAGPGRAVTEADQLRPAAARRGGRLERRRGARAGRRVQRRRYRDDRDLRQLRDARWGINREFTPRCLVCPARLTEHRTARLSREGAVANDGTAANEPGGQINIGHLNVRSLSSKLDEVLMLLRDQKLDILCLSETWLTAQVLDKFLSFPGYKIIRRDREGRRGGGVAILHRAEITAKPLAMPDSGPLESLWVSAVWRGGRHTTVGVIHLFPTNFGQSACNSVKVQPISTLRLPNHARPAAELSNRRNCLHYFRNACTVA